MILPYPISANRYWRNVKGRMVRSQEAKEYKITAGWIAKSVGVKCTTNNVRVYIELHPKAKVNGEASETRLDLDNVLKVCIDALNGIAYVDDKQVIEIYAKLSHAMKDGGLTVTVSEVCNE